MTFGAVTNETIGWTIFIVILVGVIVYVSINILRSGKAELGSEIEVAPNRKPYLPDEQLEGPKLDRTLSIALITLFVIAVGLPLYWILEPGRQAGATKDFRETFEKRGEAMFAPVGTSLDALGCEGCHGPKGVGGITSYNLVQPDGSVKVVNWRVPALDTALLRFSREELTYIITYGRTFSPMPAWGVAGGGALNDQQVQNIVDYIQSFQISPDQAQQQARDELAKMMAEKNADGSPKWASEGEALFNMGFDSDNFAGGTYACGRCHTQQWSYTVDYSQIRSISGCGALGPSLCAGSVDRQFPLNTSPTACPASAAEAAENSAAEPSTTVTTTTTTTAPAASSDACINPIQDQIDFVSVGSENGKKYGVHGQGTGRMPGFGSSPQQPISYTAPDGNQISVFYENDGKPVDPGPGMLPVDLVEKIVQYEVAAVTAVVGFLSWNPEIRNILALSVGVVILIGSVILIISTNTGPRTGVLIGLAVLLGWLTIMGLTWWIYGIGMKGTPSHWRVLNVNVGDLSADSVEKVQNLPAPDQQQVVDQILADHPELEAKVNPDNIEGKIITIGDLVDADPSLLSQYKLTPNDLGGWNLLPTSNAELGDAQAIADTALVPTEGQKIFAATADYKVLGAYDIGGKENEYKLPEDATVWNRIWQNIATTAHITHPEHFIVVQVQAVVPQETPPGGKPPTPQLDTSQPVISVVMIRSLGDLRFPGFMMFLVNGILFAVVCNVLHRRDKLVARNRAAAT